MSRRRPHYVFGLVIVIAAVACTTDDEGPHRRVKLESAEAAYNEERPGGGPWDSGISSSPEVEARFLVDGKQVGACSKRWFTLEVTCRLDAEFDLHDGSRFELIVEDRDGAAVERMGAGTLENAAELVPARGRGTLQLVSDGSVVAASLVFEALWQPVVPLVEAHVLLGIAGVLLALGLYALLRRRFLTRDERVGRSVAIITAAVATIAAASITLLLLSYGKETLQTVEPLLIAAPTALGVYAVSAVVIDAIAARSLGRRRRQIVTFAVYSVVTMPLIMMFAAVSLGAKIIIAIIVLGTLLTL